MYSVGDIIEWTIPDDIERGTITAIDLEDKAIKILWHDCGSHCWHTISNRNIVLIGPIGYEDFQDKIRDRIG